MGNQVAGSAPRDAILELPEISDLPVYSSYIANRRSAVLAVAVKLDVFTYIHSKHSGGVSVHDLCKKYDLSKRGADAFVLALKSMGLIREVGASPEEQVTARVEELIAGIRSVAAKVPALSSIVAKTAPAAPAPPPPTCATPTPSPNAHGHAPSPMPGGEGESKSGTPSPHSTPPKPRSTGAGAAAAGAKSTTPTGAPPSPGSSSARYALTDVAALYLLPGEPFHLGGLIAMEFEHFITPRALLDCMKSGRQGVYGDKDVWKEHEANAKQAKEFTRAMHSISSRPAIALAQTYDFSRHQTLLDVGGGSGAYVIAALQRHPDLAKGIVMDLPHVCEMALGFFDEAGFRGRAVTLAADMFTAPYPAGVDCILYSQILHDWPHEKGAELLRKAFDALPPGGACLVSEKLVDDADGSPVENAMVTVDMLFWTDGQQYTRGTLVAMMEAAGFGEVDVRPTTGLWSVVVGLKPPL